MSKLRAFMQQNPMAGWAVAALLMLVAAVMVYTRLMAKTEAMQLTEMVTIRDTETGDLWKVSRGVMEKELWLRPYPVDPNEGLVNPKTGKRTGFPVDAWKETVHGINSQRKEDEERYAKSGAAAPGASSPAPAAPAAPGR
jgi:hypothetical protein